MILSFAFSVMTISSISLILYLNYLTLKSNRSEEGKIITAKLIERPHAFQLEKQDRQVSV